MPAGWVALSPSMTSSSVSARVDSSSAVEISWTCSCQFEVADLGTTTTRGRPLSDDAAPPGLRPPYPTTAAVAAWQRKPCECECDTCLLCAEPVARPSPFRPNRQPRARRPCIRHRRLLPLAGLAPHPLPARVVFGRISGPLSFCRAPQTALKCSCSSDSVTRD